MSTVRLKFHTVYPEPERRPELSAEVVAIEGGETLAAGPMFYIKDWLDSRGYSYVHGTQAIWRAAA